MEFILASLILIIAIVALVYIFGGVVGLTILLALKLAAIAIYFIPTIIALYKKHESSLWIFLINVIFGWSIIGWVVAILWALDFNKTIKDFREFQAAKNAKNAVIDGEIVEETASNTDNK